MEAVKEAQAPGTRAKTQQFEARPISWRLGSEILGLDLKRSDEISDDSFRAMWKLLGERGILLFRKQGLNHDQHLAFTRRFGPLAVTGLTSRYAPEGYPDIFTVTNIKKNGERSETENAAQQWHSDQTFLQVPARASMLRCELTPQFGGDTMFADLTHVYDDLSDGLKATLEPLRAFHSLFCTRSKVMKGRKTLSEDELKRVEGEQGAMQPVVLRHPDTGRKALYINEQCVDHFEGWSIEDSRPILEYLYKLAEHPKYTYRHRWQPGDIVFWDNRCTQHYAPLDYDFAALDQPQNRRLMFRSTLA
ncbi:MAG: TauD/TfdA family dioxygenase [Rhodoferax sp.]|nr:TauD/TfdA family dioxygenase [Rhodoferax sp.]